MEGMRQQTRRAGRWTLEDQIASPWHYVEVAVPPGTRTLEVRLRFDRQSGVLDLGCLGPAGFRGWSGGARDRFVIGAAEATPGYLPGELEPGLWRVIIGLYQVPLDGLDWEIVAQTAGRGGPGPEPAADAPPPASERPVPRPLPASPGRRWWAGDLHTHTVHSDGVLTVAELARLAQRERAGLHRRHRPQHGQPPPGTGPRGPAVRDHAHPGPGGDHQPRARQRTGRYRLGGLPRTTHGLAGRDPGPGRPALGQPPVRGPGELAARHARSGHPWWRSGTGAGST